MDNKLKYMLEEINRYKTKDKLETYIKQRLSKCLESYREDLNSFNDIKRSNATASIKRFKRYLE